MWLKTRVLPCEFISDGAPCTYVNGLFKSQNHRVTQGVFEYSVGTPTYLEDRHNKRIDAQDDNDKIFE